jgi:hypothetical protein
MAHNNYSLKYRTFDQLFEDVSIDFRNYTLDGKVDPSTLLKVARRCNYELGFRIYKTRQIVLDVTHYKVRLPDDFHVLNYALVCGEFTVTEAMPQGTNIEERLVVPKYTPDPGTPDACAIPVDPCDPPDPCTGTCLTKCGDEYQLIQKIATTTRTFKQTYPLYISDQDKVECECPNTMWKGAINEANIENGFLKTNFESGKVYINYMGDMIDDNGNILVPDHELINEYYEYALKERILENLIWNDEAVGNKYELVAMKLRAARNNAMSLVNMPNFKELQKLWKVNRKAQYSKYFNMFKGNGSPRGNLYGFN